MCYKFNIFHNDVKSMVYKSIIYKSILRNFVCCYMNRNEKKVDDILKFQKFQKGTFAKVSLLLQNFRLRQKQAPTKMFPVNFLR